MLRRCLVTLRSSAIGKLVLVASVTALAFTLGSAFVARSAPTGSTFYACVNPYTGQMRSVSAAGQCAPAEQQISWNSFTGAALDAAYVNESQPDSITSAMLVDGQVTNSDLAGDSVTTDKIFDGTVNADDLGAASVGSDEVIDDALTSSDLDTGSVGSDEVLNGSLMSDDLGTDSVGSDEVVDNSLTSDDLAIGSVASDEVMNGSLTASDLGTDSVASSEIASAAVRSHELASNSVASDEIAMGAVTSNEIANSSIITADLALSLQNAIDAETLEGFEIVSRDVSVGPATRTEANVNCPAGKTAVSGGMSSQSVDVSLAESFPGSTAQEWFAAGDNRDIIDAHTMTVYAICLGS